jgi:iron complex outermembrane recepter protein
MKLDAGTAGVFTLIADMLDQPDTLDPQGLTAVQVAQNRRQASAAARAFNTRKSVRQGQLGLVHDLRLGASDALQMRVYAGDRQVTQFLGFAGDGATASGGVVELDRGYGGGSARRDGALMAGALGRELGGSACLQLHARALH